jgi:hypothetical protein
LQLNPNIFLRFKNLQSLHGAIFEHNEQVFSMAQLQIPLDFEL